MAELISMPKLGFDMAEGKLVRWVVGEGKRVEKRQVMAEIETDKATVEVESQASGIVHKHLVEEGAIVPVGDPIAILGQEGEEFDLEALVGEAKAPVGQAEPADKEPPTEEEPARPSVRQEGDGRLPGGVRASPVARRLAEEHAIDLQTLEGSGSGGRVVKRDVEVAIEAAEEEPAPEAEAPSEKRATLPPPAYQPEAAPMETLEVPLSNLRAAIGRRMKAAKEEAPHFYLTIEVDAAPLMDLRAQLNERLEPQGEKLSVNDFIVKATALALRQFPNLNASWTEHHILRHGQVNIGIAVAVEDGLLTVVLREADRKPLRLIAEESRGLAKRARDGRVRPEDVEDSTFTVSNLGMFDIEEFIAIINPPEAAILAVGGVREVPVLQEGEIRAGRRMKLTLSADHRVTDGAEGARWLQVLRGYLEDPFLLLL